jgi:hypothetical protein
MCLVIQQSLAYHDKVLGAETENGDSERNLINENTYKRRSKNIR